MRELDSVLMLERRDVEMAQSFSARVPSARASKPWAKSVSVDEEKKKRVFLELHKLNLLSSQIKRSPSSEARMIRVARDVRM